MNTNAPIDGATPSLTPPKSSLFIVDGMTCQGCARSVTEAAQGVTNVAGASVDLSSNALDVRWKPNATPSPEEVLKAVAAAGYGAQLQSDADETVANPWSPTSGWQFNLLVGGIATAVMMLAEWAFGLGMDRRYHWVAFALATPVQFLCGWRFYRGAWNQLKHGRSNMDTLVALGSTTAYGYSVALLLTHAHGHLYFMDSAAIITLISVGHYLEARTSAGAAHALRALLQLAPPSARKISNGRTEMIAVADLVAGDEIELLPGDRIPTDGKVSSGASAVNEAMLTGESLPVEKNPGDSLYGGSLNEDGRLVMEVTAVGHQTALSRIIAIVQEAQQSRARIQKLGDQISSVFVPIVILIAIGAGLWWGLAPESARQVTSVFTPFLWAPHNIGGGLDSAIFHACAVLIVACPCAMGIATPIAMMAGANAAAQRGILIRDGAALEKTGTITAVLFDKTGTLTKGKLTLVATESGTPNAREIAASLASRSAHPLSKAIAAGQTPTIEPTKWREVRGSGIEAQDEGVDLLRLGSLRWLRENHVDTGAVQIFERNWTAKGATVIALARGATLIGAFALQDQIKPNASKVVADLRQRGLKVVMLTGDSRETAIAIASSLGIPESDVHAQQRPEGKLALIKQLQKQGDRVCFVGDGINDAPALEQADLGIAVSAASDVAREAADIILLNSEIEAVPEALDLARATLRTIKQNLFWAFFYNVAGIPLAVFGFFTPIVSAAAMGASDLVVILNALRLRYRKRL